MKSMKHFEALVVMMGILSYNAMAQERMVEVTYPNDVVNTIVREYLFPATVGYVETATERYFTYADASMTVVNAEIDPGVHVLVMEVDGDIVYFCGYRDDVTPKGVVGWFDVNGLRGSSMVYGLYDDFECNGDYADTLKALALHASQGVQHVVAVGTVVDVGGRENSCLIDITGISGIMTGWSYQMGVTDVPYLGSERTSDVCITNNYIVSASTIPGGNEYVGFRRHSKSAPFAAGGMQDWSWTLLCSVRPMPWNFAITPVAGDQFATAGMIRQGFTGAWNLFYAVFDVPSFVVAGGAVTANKVALGPNTPIGHLIRDIRYDRSAGFTILTSGDYNIPYGNGSVVFEMSNIPPFGVSCWFFKDREMFSLDNYNSQQHLLTMGRDLNNKNRVDYYVKPVLQTPACANLPYYTDTSPSFMAKCDSVPFKQPCDRTFSFEEKTPSHYLDIPCVVICND